ncbi:MAG: DUF2264 domain-containing protein [Vibrio hibernica]
MTIVKEILATDRPIIPYEHPDFKMYLSFIKERLIRLKMKKKAYSINDKTLHSIFLNQEGTLATRCDDLVRYVAEAFMHYSVWEYSHAYYPGRPGQQTVKTDAMEGVSRVLPTLASWLHSNPNKKLLGFDKNIIDVADIIKKAFLSGTNPSHKGYWGTLQNYDQRICEASDLALTLWLSRDHVWAILAKNEQQQIINWFKQVNDCQTVDNNWHLFLLTVQVVIKSLTGVDDVDIQRYRRIKEFYVGGGWFRDGAKGNFDYYNAWGFHYALYWLDQIDSDFDRDFIRQSLTDFTTIYRYLLTPSGFPFFGRSACYRLAASAPLLAAVDQNSPAIQVEEVKRAFDTALSYFISNGAMKFGAPTQGLFHDDERLVDNYSGPASSFWSLRALNIALFCGERCGLWGADDALLPIEIGDFDVDIPAINAKVIGIFQTQEVIFIFKDEYTKDQTPLTRQLIKQNMISKALEKLIGRSFRPKNNLLRKGVTCYTSKMNHFF